MNLVIGGEGLTFILAVDEGEGVGGAV